MATNIVPINVYQINQRAPIPLANVSQIGFSPSGTLIRDTTTSPTRSLSTGVNVYSAIQLPSGDLYYCRETMSQLVTLFNA